MPHWSEFSKWDTKPNKYPKLGEDERTRKKNVKHAGMDEDVNLN